MLETPLALLI